MKGFVKVYNLYEKCYVPRRLGEALGKHCSLALFFNVFKYSVIYEKINV